MRLGTPVLLLEHLMEYPPLSQLLLLNLVNEAEVYSGAIF